MSEYPVYHFHKTKYGRELLIDLIRLESLDKYIRRDPVHGLSYFDITFILEGEGTFEIDGSRFPVCRNRLFFTAPGQVRKWETGSLPRGLVLIFEEEFLCNFFNDSLFVQKLSFFPTGYAAPALSLSEEQGCYLKTILTGIEKEIAKTKDFHLLRSLLYHALAWINSAYRFNHHLPEAPEISKRIFRFRHLVEQHFKQDHTVSFYAEKLCITPGHLNDLVKEQVGLTVKQYLQNRVILEAKRLLLYSELPVSEIAWALNYQDSSYFIRLFRSVTGSAPLAFRKKHHP